jgi:hypothetical protein
MLRLRYILLVLLTVLLSANCHAQKKAPTLVTITCSCDDAVGKAYVNALKAAFASNPEYQQVGLEEGVEKDAIRINIISLPITDGSDGKRPKSALSIVCLHEGALMHQFIETCDRIPIGECAKQMVADLSGWDASNA